MNSFRFSTAANRDIAEIGNHIFGLNPVAADRFLAALDETCGVLAGHPGMGQLRRELGEGVRSFPIGNYLVFYTTAPGGIDVVRVIYGGRNLPVAFVSP
jgi:toxin ParE1/3/4